MGVREREGEREGGREGGREGWSGEREGRKQKLNTHAITILYNACRCNWYSTQGWLE